LKVNAAVSEFQRKIADGPSSLSSSTSRLDNTLRILNEWKEFNEQNIILDDTYEIARLAFIRAVEKYAQEVNNSELDTSRKLAKLRNAQGMIPDNDSIRAMIREHVESRWKDLSQKLLSSHDVSDRVRKLTVWKQGQLDIGAELDRIEQAAREPTSDASELLRQLDGLNIVEGDATHGERAS
jgi:hypothetical protein